MLFMRLSLVAALFAGPVACVDDEPVEEMVKIEDSKESTKPEFTVDKNGVVKFDAEIVYFKFDDHTLTDDGMAALDALAKHLAANPKNKLQIQGHCDNRGSVEYNLALGTMRAASVRKYLENRGVEQARLATISYGEELPALDGAGENIWSKNRRADFVLTGTAAQ